MEDMIVCTLSETSKNEQFACAYENYVNDIFRLCYSYMKNMPDAEDIVQDTFLKLYRSDKTFESERHLKGWLILTASNRCKDVLKHWWRRRENIEKHTELGREDDTTSTELMEMILKLPAKYKTAVYMYYYEGYDSREIATFLHKSESTIRTWLQKARGLLKEALNDEGSEKK